MQNIIIILIVAVCTFFVGRRLFRGFGKSAKSGCGPGCGCSCSGCGPDLSSICRPDSKTDTPH
ncbi:MAG: FeoB-associated Cys-rich membrane protein [Desulfobulbaceae bacterium]